MRRRRQQKLEKKLAQFRSRDGGPDTGGTLKIYGQSLCVDVPYKTLLLSVNDTAAYVVKEMLVKYGITGADPVSYCLVQVSRPLDIGLRSSPV
jgi:afadin